MASIYCQELIRNSKVLCEGYIGEILGRKDNKQEEQKIVVEDKKSANSKDDEKNSKGSDKQNNLGVQLKENYYLEDDAKLLDVLIKNCHPILTDMLK
jgi:hypothetical protein